MFFIAVTSAVLAFALAFWVAWKEQRSVAHWTFIAGLGVLAAEALLSGIAADSILPERKTFWLSWAIVAKSFAPGIWLTFSLSYARGNYREFLKKWRIILIATAIGLPLYALAVRNRFFSINQADVENDWVGLTGFAMVMYFGFLAFAVIVLMNLERTFRASVGTMRWRIKYMIIGLCLLFVVRGYTSSQYILFHSIKPSLELVNSGALAITCLFILRSLFRAGYFEVNVYPSHAVLQHSFTVMLAGAYLLIVGIFAKAVSLFGGATAFPLKAFFILVALVVLTLILLSDRVRLQTRRFISRNFERPLHNYRTVWRRFTETTASCVDETELCNSVIKLLSDIFQVLSVTIWVSDNSDEKLRLVASSSLLNPADAAKLDAAEMAEIVRDLKAQTDPIDIDKSREKWAEILRRIHPVGFENGGHRFCVPLTAGGNLQGLILIGDRVSGLEFSEQDIDLLKCAADQTAASLLNIQLSKKLVQAKELEAFQTMSAFFVHDLKNTASTLSLMLQNLPVHYNDPAFREDALRGISKSAHHIDDLIKRLTLFRQKSVSGLKEVELNELISGVLSDLNLPPDVRIEKDFGPLPKQRLDPEQIHKVVTNLVLNAREAAGTSPEIRIETTRQNGWAVLSVRDNGCGMTPEFARDSLFRPFQTTKKNGIGIGMFQSKMIVEAHRGKIEVETQAGKGTTFRVLLPLHSETI